jgi:IclR family acetate operon transcriptional repressor
MMNMAYRLPRFISGPISRITDDRVTELGALAIKGAKEVTIAWGGMRQNG